MKILIFIIILALTSCTSRDSKNFKNHVSYEEESSKIPIEDRLKTNDKDGSNLIDDSLSSNPKSNDSKQNNELIDDKEKERLYDELRLGNFDSNTGASTDFSTLEFGFDGRFKGSHFSRAITDGHDYGLKEKAEAVGADETHESKYEGRFEIAEKIDDKTYRLVLSEFNILNDIGPSDENSFTYNVDFARGLSKDKTYYLFTKDATKENYDKINPSISEKVEYYRKTFNNQEIFNTIIYNADEDIYFSNIPN